MAKPVDQAIVNGLSVDVEDYFQVSAFERVVARDRWSSFHGRVAANTGRVLGILDECRVKATFFILGWVAEREPELMRQIVAGGHEIASHGYWHRLAYQQTPGEFREDVRRARAVLQAITGQKVIGYRAPSFSITRASLWALDILAEEGFLYDASIFPIRHDRYGIPGAPRHRHLVNGQYSGQTLDAGPAHTLVEIPASTVRIAGVNLPIAGGGYFRLLPYAWTRWGIRRVNGTEGQPVVFYLHPWELDPLQPRLEASRISCLRHYSNLASTEERLRCLLADFRFDTVASAVFVGCAGRGQAER